MTPPRILGCVMSRDEWPLIALAIDHALNGHVDHVVVVDHGSTDATGDGLVDLLAHYRDRVTIVRLNDSAFIQEAVTALMVAVGSEVSADWIYVFDADEFILPGAGRSLPGVLLDVPEGTDAVRYDVQNWVTPESFDESDLARYQEVVFRARPNLFPEIGLETPDEVECGNVSFFDVPFPSKVIVRRRPSVWLAAGAHALMHPRSLTEQAMPPELLRAGHLPLLSRTRLEKKAAHGQALMNAGFPPGHGWQSQMLRRLELAGLLDEFWQAHSIPAQPINAARTLPSVTYDPVLSEALSAAASRVTAWIGNARPRAEGISHDLVSADLAVRAVRAAQVGGDEARSWAQATERKLEHMRRDRDDLCRQLDEVRTSLDEMRGRLDEARVDRRRLETRLAAMAEELHMMRSSRSWRALAPVRAVSQRLRG